MSVLEIVRKKLAAFIAPKSKSTTALVLVPAVANNGAFLQINQPGRARDYQFICACGSGTYNYNGNDIHGTYKCSACKREYNLVLALAGTLEVSHRELERRLDSLAIVPYVKPAPQPRVRAVGDEPVRDPWSGRRDDARERAFDNADPGMMGPGFSSPKR
jgi:hypothetical protein